jgi:hypothetical protein
MLRGDGQLGRQAGIEPCTHGTSWRERDQKSWEGDVVATQLGMYLLEPRYHPEGERNA